MKNGPAFDVGTWIAWLGATVVAAATMVAYAFATFETKEDVKSVQGFISERLNRMENKIDQLLQKGGSRGSSER